MKEFNPEMANAGASINEHKVYKVVHFGLWSCVAVGSYRVRYRVGEFIAAPKGTKFFVFDSLSTPMTSCISTPIFGFGGRPQEACPRRSIELATRNIRSILRISGESTMAVAPTVS